MLKNLINRLAGKPHVVKMGQYTYAIKVRGGYLSAYSGKVIKADSVNFRTLCLMSLTTAQTRLATLN